MDILIVDDHSIFRRGVKGILQDSLSCPNIGEAGNGEECLALVRKQSWSIVILDLHLPGKNGLEVLKDIKLEYDHLPVILLSFYPEDQYAMRALKAGASGYLSKVSVAEDLVHAIKTVIAGGSYVSRSVVDSLIGSLTNKKARLPHDRLSNRELTVYQSLVEGKTLTDMAQELNVSPKTISTYKARILEKMEIQSSAELIRYAIDHNLFTFEFKIDTLI